MFSILIVDDHKHLVESLATTIPWEQYDVTCIYTAFSGMEALSVLERHKVDILLTDIRMPGMSGLELIEQAKLRCGDIDCLLVTGYAEFEYAKRAIELQAVDYLIKPVRDEALLASLSRIVQRRKQRIQEEPEAEALRIELEQLKADLLLAQTLAESSIHEERSRIAADIHDLVGHTLTTTLVQIEAAKRLLAKNKDEGLQRLDFSQDLVRKSLDSIRAAVQTIQQSDTETDLESALLHLIRTTERAADIRVTCRITPPLSQVKPPVRKAICHALQEGLTNGIRHGKASRFEFELHAGGDAGDRLHFALWNDGVPYDSSKPGFGLKAMNERVCRLGGTVDIAATDEPRGTRLSISLPFDEPQEGERA
ncbi:response regulator [Paenibacillus hamazuiensis]|uniref:response regulator n=1 Tax=Paenibacillus hamazuiensis TaxID=2936508 RepID=UPI00200D3F6A|nr:response regulator [Paenibacillus hamazuiensis]